MNLVAEKKDIIARYRGQNIEVCLFEQHVEQVRFYLAEYRGNKGKTLIKVLNLCEDRYHFLVAFTASMLEGRSTIMPANRSEAEWVRLISVNPGVHKITDLIIEPICQLKNNSSVNAMAERSVQKHFSWSWHLIAQDLIVAELYTSGSTGVPVAHTKTWGQLVNAAQQISARLGFNLAENSAPQISIVATVPPQHMFGFELSIVLPLVCGVCIYHEQPFYPLDIQRAINEMPVPGVLVTTPIHLKACTTLQQGWEGLERVISATSSLSQTLAAQVEDVLNTKVEEIYGCSEAGAIGTRRVTKNSVWELLPGYTLNVVNGDAQLRTPVLSTPLALPDRLDVVSDVCFNLVGRISDMIKIGGKRGSLADITARIKTLEGVEDAAVIKCQQSSDNKRARLAALLVVEEGSQGGSEKIFKERIRNALLKEIDSVFIPRIIYRVQALPYNATGKLLAVDLLRCLEKHTRTEKTC